MRTAVILILTLVCKLTFSQTSEVVHGVFGFSSYEEGISFAKKNSKPVLLYFNSKLSPNCRKFEKNILSDSKITEELTKNFVVINLIVDDKTPANKKLILKNGSQAKTIGEYNYDIESQYKKDYQPYVMVLDKESKPLKGSDYTSDAQEFLKYLRQFKSK